MRRNESYAGLSESCTRKLIAMRTSCRVHCRRQIFLLVSVISFLLIIAIYNFRQYERVQRLQHDQITSLKASGTARLHIFQSQIVSLKIYHIDAKPYVRGFNVDQDLLKRTTNNTTFSLFLRQIDRDSARLQIVLARADAYEQVKYLQQEATNWAKVHPYHDSYDGQDYALDAGYTQEGLSGTLDREISLSTTLNELHLLTAGARHALFLLHMLEADFQDKTAYNDIHRTDMQILAHDHLLKGQVLVVSLVEQAMRIYQDGKLVQSFVITTGRPELPSLPGNWKVLDRRSDITFTAAVPEDSPYWFPDTPILYAILYHTGGYFIHEATWRASFGSGTQFPHWDESGNTNFNTYGSHGCINLQEEDARWLYTHTDWHTSIVIY